MNSARGSITRNSGSISLADATRRYERHIIDSDIDVLGHFQLSIETLERSDAPVTDGLFSTNALTHFRDLTPSEDGQGLTSTTVPVEPAG
jgi:hypothetical protein